MKSLVFFFSGLLCGLSVLPILLVHRHTNIHSHNQSHDATVSQQQYHQQLRKNQHSSLNDFLTSSALFNALKQSSYYSSSSLSSSSSSNNKYNNDNNKNKTNGASFGVSDYDSSQEIAKIKYNSQIQILKRAKQNAQISSFHATPGISSIQNKRKGMAACLFIMDDTIRLMEWMAYHYTVLPLRYLVVGIDPHSKHPERIIRVLDQWKPYMDITIYANDTEYLQHVPYDKAWKRKYWWKNQTTGVVVRNPLYAPDKKHSVAYMSQEHKRRQNIFTAHCFQHHYNHSRTWTMTLDTDEFLLPNLWQDDESHETSGLNYVPDFVKSQKPIDLERRIAVDFRKRLPTLQDRIPVLDILQQAHLERCLRIPALNISAYINTTSSTSTATTSHTSSHANATNHTSNHNDDYNTKLLLTQWQTFAGPKEGRTTKVILDLNQASFDWLTWDKVVNVHNPNKRMCGWNGVVGSGTDYMSSIFRYHHYVAGSFESYMERQSDYRRRHSGKQVLQHYMERNQFNATIQNTDIVPWLEWFIDIVGQDVANTLLFLPLNQSYTTMKQFLQKTMSPYELELVQDGIEFIHDVDVLK